jgi:hypothetical protein
VWTLAERCGGRIDAASPWPGNGCEFRVTLRAVRGVQRAVPAAIAPVAMSAKAADKL